MRFPKEERRLEAAIEALELKLNDSFPLGTRVVVPHGCGMVYGEIFAPCSPSLGTLCIKYDSGRVHHKHFHAVDWA